MVTRNNCCKI